jgi:hypothetical protein
MDNVLINPGAPYYFVTLAVALGAVLVLTMLSQRQMVFTGLRTLPTRWGQRGRYALGHLVALPLVLLLVFTMSMLGAEGNLRKLLLVSAGAVYLYAGWVVPRKPLMQAREERDAILWVLPAFVQKVRVGKRYQEDHTAILRSYVRRPDRMRQALQTIISEALTLAEREKVPAFAALLTVARERRCQELTDICAALASAEVQGSKGLDQTLAVYQEMLTAIRNDVVKRRIARNGLKLTGASAVGLVVGVWIQILWIMIAGSGILGGL